MAGLEKRARPSSNNFERHFFLRRLVVQQRMRRRLRWRRLRRMRRMIGDAYNLGTGIGWRPELALAIARSDTIGFIEIIAENIPPDHVPLPLEQLRERGVQIIPHGVELSLGGADMIDKRRLERLARLAKRLDAPMVSEHLAFVRAGGIEAGHLLPLARTREALEILVENILEAKAALAVPLALENVASLFEWPENEMDEADFLAEAIERTDSLLLLDVSNLYANARNHGFDPLRFLDRIPLGRIAYVHIAGGITRGGLNHDTHAHRIPAGALDLLEELCRRIEPRGILLERDDNFPQEAEILNELEAIKDSARRGAEKRELAYAG
jgi:uncharacterized protein (UPF0276 family)